MGMLMHHTWLMLQQEKAKKGEKSSAPAKEPAEEESNEYETVPSPKTGGRRKANK